MKVVVNYSTMYVMLNKSLNHNMGGREKFQSPGVYIGLLGRWAVCCVLKMKNWQWGLKDNRWTPGYGLMCKQS